MTPNQELRQMLKADPGLAERMVRAFRPDPPAQVLAPREAAAAVRPLLLGFEHERLVVVGLSRTRRVLEVTTLTVGAEQFTIVAPKDILRWALTRKDSVGALVVAHNHPSGDAEPSPADLSVTRALDRACYAVGITLLDHIIISGPEAFTSLAERDGGLFSPGRGLDLVNGEVRYG